MESLNNAISVFFFFNLNKEYCPKYADSLIEIFEVDLDLKQKVKKQLCRVGLFFDSSGSAIFFSQFWYENKEANVFRIVLIIVFKSMPDIALRTVFRFFHKFWVWRAKHIQK